MKVLVRRLKDVPTAEMLEELRLRTDVEEMKVENGETYHLKAYKGVGKEKERYRRGQGPTIILEFKV